MLQLCEYGCGQKAKYQFQNGKWCCSKICQSCPGIRKIISITSKNRIPWNKNLKNVQVPWNKNLKNCFSEETLEKMRNAKKDYNPWNKGTAKKKKLKTKEEISYSLSISQKLTISQYQEKYPTFAKVEEMRYEPGKEDEKVIQVHCKNHKCKNSKEQAGWFTPLNHDQFIYRAYAIEKNEGNSYYYCSDKCKEECPLYGKRITELIKEDQIRAGHLEDPWYKSTEYQIWREQVFELDNSKCVWCEEPATIAHHILPQKTHPELSLDPENGLSCCQKCHYKYGHKEECSTGNLSKLVCERINKFKKRTGSYTSFKLEHILKVKIQS